MKVWIYKGEALPTRSEREAAAATARMGATRNKPNERPRREDGAEATAAVATAADVVVEANVTAESTEG